MKNLIKGMKKQEQKSIGRAEIETDSWIEAIFHMIMLLRIQNEAGAIRADNWLLGIYQIFQRAEARGHELTALDSLSVLISGELTPEEIGTYLAAMDAAGWIKQEDFEETFIICGEESTAGERSALKKLSDLIARVLPAYRSPCGGWRPRKRVDPE